MLNISILINIIIQLSSTTYMPTRETYVCLRHFFHGEGDKWYHQLTVVNFKTPFRPSRNLCFIMLSQSKFNYECFNTFTILCKNRNYVYKRNLFIRHIYGIRALNKVFP